MRRGTCRKKKIPGICERRGDKTSSKRIEKERLTPGSCTPSVVSSCVKLVEKAALSRARNGIQMRFFSLNLMANSVSLLDFDDLHRFRRCDRLFSGMDN